MSLEDVMSKTAKPKAQAAQKPLGRPSGYDDDLAAEICVRLSNGEPLRRICMDEKMPSQATVYVWLAKHPTFQEMYTRAREDQADTLADEIQAIADETPETRPVLNKQGEPIGIELNSAYIQWQRNRVDARKWIAAKLKPRKYGDRITHAGDADNPVEVKADISIFDAMLKNLEAKRQLGDK
jgi:hypothetical protein